MSFQGHIPSAAPDDQPEARMHQRLAMPFAWLYSRQKRGSTKATQAYKAPKCSISVSTSFIIALRCVPDTGRPTTDVGQGQAYRS